MNRKTLYTGAVVLLALLFAACDVPDSAPGQIPGFGGKAAVQVSISGSRLQSRTVAPDIELAGTAWRLLGGIGDTKTLLMEFSDEGSTVYLEPGTWSFALEGYKNNNLILSGSLTGQTIGFDSPNTLEFTVAPVSLEGSGSVSIAIELPDGSGITEARIFRDGTELTGSPAVTPVNNRIVYEYTSHPTGDYYFSVRLYKGAGLYGVVSEVVQVRNNLESAMTYTLTEEDLNNGIHLSGQGVYIGIISFAGNATDLTNGTPILLDSSGKNSLIGKLNSEYAISPQSGTALFYGVHKALANLISISTYPDKLDSMNVITFTDGLDNGSSGAAALNPIEDQTFETEIAYAEYVDDQIDTRTINGMPITAYSVGVRGSDVTNIPLFQSNLEKIASDGKDQELSDFSNLQATFTAIADSLQVVHSNTNFNMRTTLLSPGTRVRMTFDVSGTTSSGAAGSLKYLEGVISRTGTGAGLTYTLGDITYGDGLDSIEGAGPINGTVVGAEVNFAFTGMSGYNPDTDESLAKQWTMVSGTSEWQVNSEYSISGATDVQIEERSAIIYLVLDASTSLNITQMGQIRSAVIEFINALYNQLNQ